MVLVLGSRTQVLQDAQVLQGTMQGVVGQHEAPASGGVV
jgi:hypothetical protein